MVLCYLACLVRDVATAVGYGYFIQCGFVKEMFTREEIRMLNKNGEEHGTITCRIDDKENFEVTALR